MTLFERTLYMTAILAGAAFGRDPVQVSVTPASDSAASAIVVNGNPSVAVGTVQLFYEVHAYQFPSGNIASFRLNLLVPQGTTYSGTLTLEQVGADTVRLSPDKPTFSVSGLNWSDSTGVTVAISPEVAQRSDLNRDGTELVGNLKVRGPQFQTMVQVHVRLVHPTACLKLYDFLTDQEMTQSVTSLGVNVKKDGTTQLTSVPQLSNNVMVVNTCASPESFDLGLVIDGSFTLNNGNPVFTYTKAGYSDPALFAISEFENGTPAGVKRCFQGVTLPAGQTFLVTVHMSLDRFAASALPSSKAFSFSATAYTPGTGCPGTLNTVATPNPATLSVPFYIMSR